MSPGLSAQAANRVGAEESRTSSYDRLKQADRQTVSARSATPQPSRTGHDIELPMLDSPGPTGAGADEGRYGPPTIGSAAMCYAIRGVSTVFSLSFFGSLLVCAIVQRAWSSAVGVVRPRPRRPFADIERVRAAGRSKAQRKVVRDIGYYAGLVGLEVRSFTVVTPDGFVLDLFRVIVPGETSAQRRTRYPVLLIHGLLQSAGAFCMNDEDSLAFFLARSGFDVWIGSNRCGFTHRHVEFSYNDPRMWDWDVRAMATKDLPTFVDHVLDATGHAQLGLVAHSQGTTETFLALAREQCPDLGMRLSVFCALAPAVYAGPLVDRRFFKFIRRMSPLLYRLTFGMHAFIPSMIVLRDFLPKALLGHLSYAMFHFLFRWSDSRWDRGLRDRMFYFSPVYISAESMRWWLGRDSFATRRCIFESDAAPWFDRRCPPLALWIAEQDSLVGGDRLLRRLATVETEVTVVHAEVVPEYEHLDVLWAVDAVDRVFAGVRATLWRTARNREAFRTPLGC
ncbi:Alpha/Beta hydrolase protein [Dipodascopsis tothii]|uniref:Alpha/Beta hydrolase protein n=1 Tax=Dipodascopsis tothii TaxID=44089 RepID=UPI0034CF4439